jgi:hypothetical protein
MGTHIKNVKDNNFFGLLHLSLRNWVISIVFPPKEHLFSVTISVPDENARSADTLET